jgi:nifR3 family TIM-barrel protein
MVQPLQIGPLRLASNLLLAPLSGYTDVAFRLTVRACGSLGLACTDLLSPQAIIRENERSMHLTTTCPEDSPLAMQLYSGDADWLCQAVRWAEDHGAHVVDLNMGCPVDKVTRCGAGSALLREPDKTLAMVEKMLKVARRPLTVKLRLGWDRNSIVAPYLARRLEEMGVAMVAVHGRTAGMGYAGNVDLDGIAAVVAAVKRMPIVGNGDVRSPQDAQRMIELTGCQGVMIGRMALQMPWILRDAWSYLTTGVIPPPPTIEEKCGILRMHFDNLLRFRDEHAAVSHFHKRIATYGKQMNPCRMLKDAVRQIKTAAEFYAAVERFLEWRRTQSVVAAVPPGRIA